MRTLKTSSFLKRLYVKLKCGKFSKGFHLMYWLLYRQSYSIHLIYSVIQAAYKPLYYEE